MSFKKSIYEELGIKTIINAAGPRSICGGTRVKPEVLEAMAQASQFFVNICELNEKIGTYIADITGAEAGMVTNGTANALALSAAACMTGTDIGKIRRLPNTEGLKNEIIIQKIHCGEYRYFYTFAGAKLIEVGNINECLAEELNEAINEKTAAIAYLIAPRSLKSGLSLKEVVKIAHARGIPVIVDAAAMLPPKENLRHFINEGADLVAFSGGKFIHGPQSTGILFGQKNLVKAALANANPNHGIGRISKVSKEDMVGLYVSLKLYEESDEKKIIEKHYRTIKPIYNALKNISNIKVSIEYDQINYLLPTVTIQLLKEWKGPGYGELEKSLLNGSPSILVQHFQGSDVLIINPISLQKNEAKIVAECLAKELGRYA
jgi:L-seryl-tRNA(Ser) seleniumtransferase